ncbi:lysine--tRNA ligase [Halococcus thailandensis]|uniref:lysine--tRNA ligase n=1 Tax=Halococcus thailandensis TaxID=335952 RepID=UPI000ACDE7FA|nr:lysine--tRNA ligase [Halococcus thailandensis]
MTDDPYILAGSQSRDFWAESVADVIDERKTDDPIVIKGGISPSGVPHLGNMNEIARGYFVAEALRERGRTVRQIFTADDRDPLRKVPRKLADLDGNVVGLGEVDAGALGRNLGKPYTAIPDPFGCCESYGAHFSNLIERSAELLDIPVETVSNTERYESGAFDDVIHHLLEHREQARNVLAQYQEKVDDDYIPFRPICAECGHVTETDAVKSVDLDAGTVDYVCSDVEAGEQTIEGCGHEGTATFQEGKLPWRFEWPAQWQVLDVDFEPFGKDHAEGSWPSGADITRTVLDDTPPVPMAYEWFTLDGEPFSSSAGHVIMVQDVLEMVEPEVLRYFFTKDPGRARDFSINYLNELVTEFDEFEQTYFQELKPGYKMEGEAKAAYPSIIAPISDSSELKREFLHSNLAMNFGDDIELNQHSRYKSNEFDSKISITSENIEDVNIGSQIDILDIHDRIKESLKRDRIAKLNEPFGQSTRANLRTHQSKWWDDRNLRRVRRRVIDKLISSRIRLPYTFAAILGMTEDSDLRESMARREGHIPEDAPRWAVENALARVEYARTWAKRTNNAYNYRLVTDLPDAEFDDDTGRALDELADVVEAGHGGEAIQSEIFETAREHDLDPGDLFTAGYRLFFDTDQGPKLGPFLAELDREFVVRRLRREG